MSTIPGGCFVAPDSLRRYQQLQRQHAREAKMQEGGKPPAPTAPESPPESPPVLSFSLPPADHSRSTSLTQLISTVPMRLSEMLGRTRSMSSPQSSPPATPPMSPNMPRSPLQSSGPMTIPKLKEDDCTKNLDQSQLSESI